MPCCLLVAVGFFIPRLTLFFLWALTTYIGRAYQTSIVPLLGFFFLPYSTLAYAVAQNEFHGLKDFGLLIFVLGLLMDFGFFGGASRSRRRRAVVEVE